MFPGSRKQRRTARLRRGIVIVEDGRVLELRAKLAQNAGQGELFRLQAVPAGEFQGSLGGL